MGEVSIAVTQREESGKSANRKLRADGKVPAVVYSKGVDPLKLSLDPVVLDRKIRASHAGINTLFDLEGEGQLNGRTVMVKELQRDPVKGTVLHADFHEIDLTQLLNVTVPIQLTGTAPGVSMGGLIEHTLREIELACMPGSIPDEV
ncbi:MAG: 50S ribosomal protein L25, partial [Deltaproteobacteria bacterium]|nr:50S ribosomal protein L25 [Deltaproteobacteria bacterium]